MRGLLLSNFKRAFCSKWYIISVIGTVIMCFISTHSYFDKSSDLLYVIDLMINLGLFKKVIVFFSAIPFVTVFCQDYNSGYINSVVSRSGEKSYILSNMVICVVSGFSAVFLGIMLFSGIILPFFPLKASSVYTNIASNTPFIYLLFLISIFSLYAAMWTAAGLAMSSILPDKYAALGSPLIFGYILEELTLKLPPHLNLYAMSHPGWEILGKSVFLDYFYTISVFVFVIVISGCIFSHFVKRRIRNEMV